MTKQYFFNCLISVSNSIVNYYYNYWRQKGQGLSNNLIEQSTQIECILH